MTFCRWTDKKDTDCGMAAKFREIQSLLPLCPFHAAIVEAYAKVTPIEEDM